MEVKKGKQPGGLAAAGVAMLFLTFFLLAAFVLTAGVRAYRETSRRTEETFRRRTALSYLVNQARQADRAAGVAVGRFHGSDALILRQTIGGAEYVTYIYCHGGWLRELFTEEGTELPPESGMEILPVRELKIGASPEGMLSFVTADENGAEYGASLWPRCGIAVE